MTVAFASVRLQCIHKLYDNHTTVNYHRWNRSPRPQPQAFTKLVFLIWFSLLHLSKLVIWCSSWGRGFRFHGSNYTTANHISKQQRRPPNQYFWFQRVWLKHNLNFKEWTSHIQRDFPGNYESTNLSRDSLSREIGRSVDLLCVYIYIYMYIYVRIYIYIYSQ